MDYFNGQSRRSSISHLPGSVQSFDFYQVVEYLLYQLITNYETDTAVRAALDNYDFYVLPIVNPDGEIFFVLTFP